MTAGKQQLAQLLDRALKDNGPIVAPKKMKPLLASYDKGCEFLKKKKIAEAIKEFQSAVKAGGDKKAFPDDPPSVVQDASERLAEIKDQGTAEIDKADELIAKEPMKARAEYERLLKLYGAIEELKNRIDDTLIRLPAAK